MVLSIITPLFLRVIKIV